MWILDSLLNLKHCVQAAVCSKITCRCQAFPIDKIERNNGLSEFGDLYSCVLKRSKTGLNA